VTLSPLAIVFMHVRMMKLLFNGFSLVSAADGPHHGDMRIVGLLVLIGAACALAPGWAGDGGGTPIRIVVVVGTGDADLDIPAVQAAVDQGGYVVLRGHFSFDRAPAKPLPPQALFPRMGMVVVSREVSISGTRDERGGMTSVDGGTWPFAVEVSRVPVAIQGWRFAPSQGLSR
jgi:hypothetical protein